MRHILSLIVSFWGVSLVQSIQKCNVLFDIDGNAALTKTLFGCSKNMTDPLFPYSTVNQSYGPTQVNIQVVLNNFYDLDAVAGTVQLDVKLRLTWIDPRWDIPELWRYISADDKSQGLIIERLVRPNPQDCDTLEIWTPHMEFRDAVQIIPLNSNFRFRQNGELYTTTHMLLTVGQPNLNLKDYPLESHHIELVIQPFSYNYLQNNLSFDSPPVLYVSSPDGTDINFEKNAEWLHTAGE